MKGKLQITDAQECGDDDGEEDACAELLGVFGEDPAGSAEEHPNLGEEGGGVSSIEFVLGIFRVLDPALGTEELVGGWPGVRGGQDDGGATTALVNQDAHKVVGGVGVGGGGEAGLVEGLLGLADGPIVDEGARVEEDQAVEEGEDVPGGLVDGADDGAVGLLDQDRKSVG